MSKPLYMEIPKIQDDFNVASMMANRDLPGDNEQQQFISFYMGRDLREYGDTQLREIIIEQAQQIEGLNNLVRKLQRRAASRL